MLPFFILFVVVVIALIYDRSVEAPQRQTEKDEKHNLIEEYIEENNVEITAEYRYSSEYYENNINLERGIYYRVIVDNKHKKIHIINKHAKSDVITFNSIIGFEIITDSEVTGGVGRAVVGGMIAGGAGAVVGAVTAKEKISSYKVVFYLADIQSPTVEITLIREKTKTKNRDYINAVEFASKLDACVRAIMATR